MKLGRWILRIAAAVSMLLCVASAQTSDYKMQLVTGTGSSDTGTPSLTIKSGDSGSAVVNIIPLNGFNQKVSFSCTGVPSNGSCSFNPTTVTPDGVDPTTTTLTIRTVANASATAAPAYRRWIVGSCFAIAGVFLMLPGGARRRRVFPASMVLTVIFLLLGTACGGGDSSIPSNQVQPGTYDIQVNSTSGSITHGATLQLIVTRK